MTSAPLLPTIDRREYVTVRILALRQTVDDAGVALIEALVGENRGTLVRKVAPMPVGDMTPAGPLEALEVVDTRRGGRIWLEMSHMPIIGQEYRVLESHVQWE